MALKFVLYIDQILKFTAAAALSGKYIKFISNELNSELFDK